MSAPKSIRSQFTSDRSTEDVRPPPAGRDDRGSGRDVMPVAEVGPEACAQTEQLATVVADGFAANEREDLMGATALHERLGEGI